MEDRVYLVVVEKGGRGLKHWRWMQDEPAACAEAARLRVLGYLVLGLASRPYGRTRPLPDAPA